MAAAVLALVVGTVASLLFAFEARRQADIATDWARKLEEQATELKEQTRRAQEKEEEATRVLLSGLLIPFGRNQLLLGSPLDGAEWEVVRHIRAAPVPIRLRFLEAALREPDAARRVGRRADWIAHAIVGSDRAVRAEAAQRIVQRIQDPETPQEVLLACARFGLSVNLKDRVWAERSAAAVVVALCDPTTSGVDYPYLAETLAAVSELLPPTRAAEHAAQVIDGFLPLLQDPNKLLLAFEQIGQAVVVISPWLDADAAARTAAALGTSIRQPASYPITWESLARALAAVCRRLPPPDATAHRDRMVDLILEISSATPVKDKTLDYRARVRTLLPLCGGLDATRSARVADAILAILGDSETIGFINSALLLHKDVADVLTAVTERLDARGNLRAAEELIRVLRKADDRLVPPEELKMVLLSVSRRLDAAGTGRVAEAVIAAVGDPETSVEGRTAFAGFLVAVGDRLDPARAEFLERALVDSLLADLANVKPSRLPSGIRLCQSLSAVCRRPGTQSAVRATGALTEIICNPQTPIEMLEPLVTALVQVGGQMPREEATARVNRAIAVLDTLWRTRTKPLERVVVARALTAAWKGLGTTEASDRARRVVADLEDLTGDPKLVPFEHSRLPLALAAAYEHLEPAEKAARANRHLAAHAKTLLAALRNSKLDFATGQLAGALVVICVHLDRPEAGRVFDALLTVLNDPERDRYPLAFHKEMIKKAIVRLDEADLRRILGHLHAAGHLQRVILDALGEAKQCSFRNTWDYLDRTASHENATSVP
jgi:hypothetical protein